MSKKKKTPAEIEAEAARIEEANAKMEKALDSQSRLKAKMLELNGEEEEEITEDQMTLLQPEPSKLEKVLAELQDEGKFTVSHVIGGMDSKLGQFSINEWPDALESCARAKGGGTFKVVFRDGGGHFKHQFTQTFDPETYSAFKRPEPTPVPQMSNGMESLAPILQMMMQQQQQNSAMMLEMVKAQNQTGPGLMKSASDVVAIAKLFQGEKKNPFEEISTLVKVLNSLRDEAEEDSPLERVIDKVGAILTPLIEVGASKLRQGPQRVNPLPPVAGQAMGQTPKALISQPSSPPAAAPASQLTKEQAVVAAYCEHLKKAIQTNQPPQLIASLAVNTIQSDEDRKEFLKFAKAEDSITKMVAYDPSLASHQEWIRDFFDGAIDAIEESEEEEKYDAYAEVEAELKAQDEAENDESPDTQVDQGTLSRSGA